MSLPISDPKLLLQTVNLQRLLLCFPAFFVIFILHRLYFSPLSSVPGPIITALTSKYLPLLSHLNRRTVTLHEWHKRYGPIVRISPTEVSVVSPQGVKEIYSDPAYGKYLPLYGIYEHYGEGNAFCSGPKEDHGWRRKAVSDRYTMSYVLKEEERTGKILHIVNEYLGFIKEGLPGVTNSQTNHKNGSYKVDIYLANTFFATDVVSAHLFGPRFSLRTLSGNKADRELIDGHYEDSRSFHPHLIAEFPKLMEFMGSLSSRWESLSNMVLFRKPEPTETYVGGSKIDDWGWHAYQNAKADKGCNGHVAEKLASLVKEGQEDDGQTWSDEKAASELMDHMLAGMDTSSDTLTFLMYHLSLDSSKQIQRKLQTELAAASAFLQPSQDSEKDEQKLSADSLSKILQLPYLDVVLKEALRIYTAIPGTLPRVVPSSSSSSTAQKNPGGSGRYIEGYFLPAGTVVGSFAHGIHRDKDVFVVPERSGRTHDPEVDDFYPERWLIGEGEAISRLSAESIRQEEERIRTMERRFWAFGSGARGCVGKNVAILKMKLLLAMVYTRYNTEVDFSDEKATLSHYHWDERRIFRDVLPYRGVKGIINFIPRHVQYAQNP